MSDDSPGGRGETGARVLVVDDDDAICRAVAAGLSLAGYYVVTANDAASAALRSAETPPDVAIVDLEMPDVGGIAVISELKRQCGAAAHAIVLTAHADEQNRSDAFAAGANDYILKPLDLAELRRRVGTAVRTQQEYVRVRLEKEVAERLLVYGQEASALLAHDLNNSLAVTLANLAFVLESPIASSEIRDALTSALGSVRRMSSLVGNFVDIARFEDAAVKPTVTLVRVHELLESVIAVGAPAKARQIRYEIDCDPVLEARFDVQLVERVLHNLFGNATRYCNTGGVITLAARPWHDVGSIELRVQNSGEQIPERLRADLFGKYVRGKGGKRGMGLYFCRLVAEAHGGRIEYEAHADGPVFVVQLPGRA